MMTRNTQNGNNKKRKYSKRKKSKFLLRRITIVMTFFFIVWLAISMIGKAFNRDDTSTNQSDTTGSNASQEIDETANTDTPVETIETIETIETTETTEATEATDMSAPTEISLNTTTETAESTTKEGASMDFTAVSYYIQTRDARYQAYFETHKAMSTSDIVRDVNINLDYAFYDHVEKVVDPNALKVICNKYYQLPSNFTPDTLVSVPEGYFVADGKSYQLKQNALDAFIAMSDAAKKDGLSLRIISSYRSNSYQANLYQKYKNNNGQTAADRFSARPGHSEHETGLAIDINEVAQTFENTEEFTWLSENAHKYGYILRYPEGMESVTGYMYEPWHYRYLGAEVATQLKNLGLTYDAYYAIYLLK